MAKAPVPPIPPIPPKTETVKTMKKSSVPVPPKKPVDISEAEKEWLRMGDLLAKERIPGIDSTNTLYDELMQKEDRVLSTIDRYIADQRQNAIVSKRFINTHVMEIPVMMFKTINDILDEATKKELKTPRDVAALFTSGTRIIYVGILLIIFAIFILFL